MPHAAMPPSCCRCDMMMVSPPPPSLMRHACARPPPIRRYDAPFCWRCSAAAAAATPFFSTRQLASRTADCRFSRDAGAPRAVCHAATFTPYADCRWRRSLDAFAAAARPQCRAAAAAVDVAPSLLQAARLLMIGAHAADERCPLILFTRRARLPMLMRRQMRWRRCRLPRRQMMPPGFFFDAAPL